MILFIVFMLLFVSLQSASMSSLSQKTKTKQKQYFDDEQILPDKTRHQHYLHVAETQHVNLLMI